MASTPDAGAAAPRTEPLRDLAEHVAGMCEKTIRVCRENGYVFSRFPRNMEKGPPNRDGERWEALAFSLYSDIAEACAMAHSALRAAPAPATGDLVRRLREEAIALVIADRPGDRKTAALLHEAVNALEKP